LTACNLYHIIQNREGITKEKDMLWGSILKTIFDLEKDSEESKKKKELSSICSYYKGSQPVGLLFYIPNWMKRG